MYTHVASFPLRSSPCRRLCSDCGGVLAFLCFCLCFFFCPSIRLWLWWTGLPPLPVPRMRYAAPALWVWSTGKWLPVLLSSNNPKHLSKIAPFLVLIGIVQLRGLRASPRVELLATGMFPFLCLQSAGARWSSTSIIKMGVRA